MRPARSSLQELFGSVPALKRPLSDEEMIDIAREEHSRHVAEEGDQPGILPRVSATTQPFAPVQGLLIDLDGVVYTGGREIPGAGWFMEKARLHRLPFLLVTNNSTTSPAGVAERLQRMGITAKAEEVLTSADAAAAFIARQDPHGAITFAVGEAGLRQSLQAAGLRVADQDQRDGVEWVVVGLDRQFDYAKLAAATRAIRGGARFVATNVDALLPVEGGDMLPGAGTMVAAIQAATGIEPTVVGKPGPALFQAGLQRLGLPSDAVAMVGDRVDTDIDGAHRAGLRAILVLTGVTSQAMAAALAVQPESVLPDLAAVATLLGWTPHQTEA